MPPSLIKLFNPSTLLDSGVLFIGRICIIGLQILFLKMYSTLLVPDELGKYFFLLTLSYTLNAFLFVALDNYQQAHLYEYVRDGISLRSYIDLNVRVFSPILLVIALADMVLYRFYFHYLIPFNLLIFISIFLYLTGLLRGLLNNLEHKRHVAFIFVLEASLKVLLFYVFTLMYAPSSTMLLCTYLMSLLIVFVVLCFSSHYYAIFKKGTQISIRWNDLLRFAYPLSFGAVINWLQTQGYRMILVPMGNASLVGIYTTISNIGSAAYSAFAFIYNQINMPTLYKTQGRSIGTHMLNGLIWLFVIAFAAWIFSPLLVSLASRKEFVPYAYLILYGILIEGTNLFVGAIGTYYCIKKTTIKGFYGSIISIISVIPLSFLTYRYFFSVNTIGLPILLSQMVVALSMLFTIRKEIFDSETKSKLKLATKDAL